MKQIFINLPVKNLQASRLFYEALGFTSNPLFSFHNQQCMVWSEQIYVMLQSYEMFRPAQQQAVAGNSLPATASFTLPVESPGKMNYIMANGLKAGGTEPTTMQDEGFMQVRNINDPDGRLWAIIYLDLATFKKMKGR